MVLDILASRNTYYVALNKIKTTENEIMSMYNMMNGVNTIPTFFVLPVLGQHPETYPRFRDCFLKDEEHPEYEGKIHIYTRVGGGNREGYAEEIEELRNKDGYVDDYDDSFDSTYAMFVFEIPEKWKPDIEKLLSGKMLETSKEYQDLVIATFPKIADKLRNAFNPIPDNE